MSVQEMSSGAGVSTCGVLEKKNQIKTKTTSLHWLLVTFRVDIKVLLLVY